MSGGLTGRIWMRRVSEMSLFLGCLCFGTGITVGEFQMLGNTELQVGRRVTAGRESSPAKRAGKR